MASKIKQALCILLLICFAPFLLGLTICLLFFPPTCSYLLECGADFAKEDTYGRDALLWAVCARHESTVRVLLDRMLRETNLPFNCRLALKMAGQKGYDEIALMLQEGINRQTGIKVDKP